MRKVPLPTDDESLLRSYMAEVAERLKDLEDKAQLKRAKRQARAERKRLKQEAERLQAEQKRKERQAAIQRNIDRLVGPSMTLERVRYLSENACRPKRPLPKPTPVVEPTKLDPPYENAA